MLHDFISNAIKYNDKDLTIIDINVKGIWSKLEFSIRDNGPGIDKQYHQKIFQMFQTLQAKDKFESTGVGLAVVRKLLMKKKDK